MYSVKRRNNLAVISSSILVAVLSILLSTAFVSRVGAVASTGGTTIGAVVCGPASTVTITKPVNDSVVTTNPVTLEGTISQSNQIEIQVDGQIDSIIPVDLGQTRFTGQVQLSAGTRTIKLVAVNICAGPSGTASSVVTYSPDSNGSNGSDTPTNIGGVTAPGTVQSVDESSSPSIGEQLLAPLIDLAKWLNIGLNDSGDVADPRLMSPGQAVSLAIGLVLLTFGVTKPMLIRFSRVPVIGKVKPLSTLLRRRRFYSICVRLIGLSIVLGLLFL